MSSLDNGRVVFGDERVAETPEVDPVCGMKIRPSEAAGHMDHDGRTYYFCSNSCMEQFEASPERFAGVGQQSPTPPL